MPFPSKHALLSARLKEVEELLTGYSDVPATSSSPSSGGPNVQVVIGTSKLMEEQPDLADRVSKMIEDAYLAVGGNPKMLQTQPVLDRLKFGDGSDPRGDGRSFTNRVLHLAFVDGALAGCVSSSKTTTWNSQMGHWGLLVVDTKMQGKGVASALMAAAEARVLEYSGSIQIEYEFDPTKDHSKKLEEMYSKRGFKQVMKVDQGSTEFRVLYKTFTDDEQKQGKKRGLLAEKENILSLLSSTVASSEVDQRPLKSRTFYEALSAFVKDKDVSTLSEGLGGVRNVYQFVVIDAEPVFKFVLDLKTMPATVKEGEDSNAGVTITITDDNLASWCSKDLDWTDAFWRGKVIMTSPLPLAGGPGTWWSDSVNKLADFFGEMKPAAN